MTTSARPSLKSAMSRVSKWSIPDLAEPLLSIPPDGGWGWAVCVASFFCNFIVDGTMYCFGVFLPEISRDIGVEQTQIALASSLLSGFYYILGPLNCAACNHYGFRIVGITGGVLSAGAFFCASYLHALLPFLMVTGVWGGMAFNLIYTPAAIAVGFYFEKWRALALSLVVCGTASGIVAFPPLITRALASVSWRIKFKILAGLCLFCSMLCLVYKPIKVVKVKIQGDADTRSMTEEESRHNIFQKFRNKFFPTMSDLSVEIADSESNRHSTDSKSHIKHLLGTRKENDNQSLDMGVDPSTFRNALYTLNEDSEEEIHSSCFGKCRKKRSWGSVARSVHASRISMMSRTSRLTQGPLALASVAGPAMAYTLSVTRAATQRDLDQEHKFRCCPESFLRTLGTMLDADMFRSPSFMMLATSGCLSLMGMYIPLIYVAKRATDEYKIEEKTAVLLITIIGVSNLFGRICCTLVSCVPNLNLNVLTYVTLIICGMITFASSYLNTFILQAVFCAIFGFTISTFHALRSILFVELFGLENLTNCFGINMLFQSLASFLGVPIANALYSISGNFFLAFAFSGGVIALSGIILIPVERVQYWEENRLR